MSLNTLLATQEVILNRYLKLDPEMAGRLTQLSGKVVKIEWIPLSCYWLFRSDTIYLTRDHRGSVDLVLSGSIFDFMRTAFMKKDAANMTIPLQISGDMEFAAQFKDLFSNLEIDWEEQLSRLFGDTLAYPMACFLKIVSQWARQSVESLSQNVTDYLQAEMNGLVPAAELQTFFSEVDDFRDDAERLQARIQALQRGLES